MATEAAWFKRKNPLVRKRKTDLTLTGLLMEGLIRAKCGLTYESGQITQGMDFFLFERLVFGDSRERLTVKSKRENVHNGTSLHLRCD
jgi:hypothetical protein